MRTTAELGAPLMLSIARMTTIKGFCDMKKNEKYLPSVSKLS